MPIVIVKDKEHQTNVLASYLPNDYLFQAKWISNSYLRKLLNSISAECLRCAQYLEDLINSYKLKDTTVLLDKWESSLNIPDNCFDGKGTIEQRRLHVLCKFAYMNCTTVYDFVSLANKLGYNIEIVTGSSRGTFPYTFPIYFFNTAKDARFTMIVIVKGLNPSTFPFTFPLVFRNNSAKVIENIINKLKPANVRAIFEYV